MSVEREKKKRNREREKEEKNLFWVIGSVWERV